MSNIDVEKKFDEYKNAKKRVVDNNLSIDRKLTRKIIRPIMRGALFGQRILKGQKVEKMGNFNYKLPKDRSTIFVVSHIGKYDFEIVNELIKQQFYTVASDFRNMYGNFNGFMMDKFGVIFVDENSKEDKKYTSKMMKKILNSKSFGTHLNIMIFSEGTWNITENEPIMDIHFGAVDAALSTNSVILPIAVEQYDRKFVVNFGDIYDPCEIVKADKIDYNNLDESKELDRLTKFKEKVKTNTLLRDKLATLKYNIWEKNGVEKRKDIPDNYWENFINDRLAEWPGYSMQEQIDSVYHPKEKLEQQKVKKEFEAIKINDKNSFVLTNPERYLNYLYVANHIDTILEQLKIYNKSESCVNEQKIKKL